MTSRLFFLTFTEVVSKVKDFLNNNNEFDSHRMYQAKVARHNTTQEITSRYKKNHGVFPLK